MKLYESGENYLETILLIAQRKGSVRSIDIAGELQYTKPSVSRAMAILKKAGYIVMDENGLISLTDSGRETAGHIYERHRILKEYLVSLGVDEAIASEDACRIEHVISQQTFEKIKKQVD